MDKKYIVYVHIFPNGKKYDGIVFYNQRRLAEYMGEKPSTVNAWIKGRNPIPKHYLEKGFKVIK